MYPLATTRDPHTTPPVAVPPEQPPPKLDHHEKMRIRAAAFRGQRLYPGPVGDLVARELLSWEEFGYRMDQHGITARLVDHLLKAPLTT